MIEQKQKKKLYWRNNRYNVELKIEKNIRYVNAILFLYFLVVFYDRLSCILYPVYS